MNNKLLISMLASIVVIAGIIAFTPVEQATTLHNEAITTTGNFVTLDKHFARNTESAGGHGGGTIRIELTNSFTFIADSDAIITSIWISTSGDDVCLTEFNIGEYEYRGTESVLDLCPNLDDFAFLDLLRKWEKETQNPFSYSDAIPVEAKTPVTLHFKLDADNQGEELTVWISYEGGSGATLT